MSHSKIILIAGPTASGKSALALELAKKNRGMIINADAMQIYTGLPLLSAQPAPQALSEIPHELYGALPPTEASSVGRWLSMAQAALLRAHQKQRTPIFVGGTGLYFRALFNGIAPIPSVPNLLRSEVQQLYDQLGETEFRHKLSMIDPESAARLARNDRQRLVRAYEVALHTGKPLAQWHQERTEHSVISNSKVEPYLLIPPREALYAACDNRFLKMIDDGAIDEVRQFLTLAVSSELPSAKTIGLRELTDFLKGKVSLEQAILEAQQATRNYAKRQLTWFRHQWDKLLP